MEIRFNSLGLLLIKKTGKENSNANQTKKNPKSENNLETGNWMDACLGFHFPLALLWFTCAVHDCGKVQAVLSMCCSGYWMQVLSAFTIDT